MIVCRAPEDADIAFLAGVRNDLETQYALLADPRPNSEADVRRWVRQRVSDPSALFTVIVDDLDGTVGFAQIVNISERSRHGEFGIAVGAPFRRRGYARAALGTMLAAAAADGRLDKVVLHVAADNPARALYAEAGFVEVGTHRHHYRAPDGWHDVTVMERFLAGAPAS